MTEKLRFLGLKFDLKRPPPPFGLKSPPPPPDRNLRGGGAWPHLSKKGVQKPVPVSRIAET